MRRWTQQFPIQGLRVVAGSAVAPSIHSHSLQPKTTSVPPKFSTTKRSSSFVCSRGEKSPARGKTSATRSKSPKSIQRSKKDVSVNKLLASITPRRRSSSRSRMMKQRGLSTTTVVLPTPTPPTTEALLESFVQKYHAMVSTTDIASRVRIALLEEKEYLHISDPLYDEFDEEGIQEMATARRMFSQAGVDVDEVPDVELKDMFEEEGGLRSLLEEEMKNKPVEGGNDSKKNVSGHLDDLLRDPKVASHLPSSSGQEEEHEGMVSALENDIFEAEYQAGADKKDKIVQEDDLLAELQADPQFDLAMDEVTEISENSDGCRSFGEQHSSQAPRLFFSFLQRASFKDPGQKLSANSAASHHPRKPSTEERRQGAEGEELPPRFNDPLGIENVAYKFYDKEALVPSVGRGALHRPPSSREDISQLPSQKVRPEFGGLSPFEIHQLKFEAVETLKHLLQQEQGSSSYVKEKKPEGKPLKLSTGMTTVAIGLSIDGEKKDMSSSPVVGAEARGRATCYAVITETQQVDVLKRKANDLYPHLLLSTVDFDCQDVFGQ